MNPAHLLSVTRPRTSTSSVPPRRYTLARRRRLVGLLFISPWVIGFLLLKFLPILASLGLSLTNFDLVKPEQTQFIGLANYVHIPFDEGAAFSFFASMSQAIFSVPLQLIVSFSLAALLNSARLRAKTLLRTLFFLPSIIPGAAIVSMWFGFLDPTNGWLNRLLLQPLGLPPFAGASNEGAYNLLIAILALWSIGPGMLIMLGALQSVPQELYESARVDGAGPFLRLVKITLPLVSPAIFFSLIIDLMSVFGGVALLDRGTGFAGEGASFDGYIYDVMFHGNQLGYAASLAWIFFIAMLGVTLVLFRTSRRWVFYTDGEAD
ncbi:MAG: sugar ABC transporter permease [Anaerolineae bacterium]